MIQYENTDFFGLIFRLKGSIFDNVLSKLVISVLLSILASIMHSYGWLQKGGTIPAIDELAFKMSGTAIAFLLVFRSNISFQRFWEGRGHLGAIMAHGRDLGRQVAFCIRQDEGPSDDKQGDRLAKDLVGSAVAEELYGDYDPSCGVGESVKTIRGFRRMHMARCLLMFWRTMVQHVQDETTKKDVEKIWLMVDKEKPSTQKSITTHGNEALLGAHARRPLVVLAMLTDLLRNEYRARNITHMEYLAMNKNIHGLIGGFNGVDKVHSVQVPFPYAQMILLFLSLYCFLAPFMLVTYFGWLTVVPAMILSLAFFGINEVAIEIEDPFGTDDNDLPVDGMGNALKGDCEMYLELAGVPSENLTLYWQEIGKMRMPDEIQAHRKKEPKGRKSPVSHPAVSEARP